MPIHVTPIPRLTAFAAPALTLGTANAAGAAETTIATNSTLLAFDTTLPDAITMGQSGATGSATVTARRDHAHAMETGSGVAKCWVINSADASTILASYNLTSLTASYVGTRLYTFDTDFSSANYSAVGSAGYPAGNYLQAPIFGQNVRLAGSIECIMRSTSGSGANVDVINFCAFFGEQ